MEKRYYFSIASGSSGNCGLYYHKGNAVLIDLGVSVRKLRQALEKFALDIPDLRAILLTHEHTDHVKGLATLTKKYQVPIYATHGTGEALCEKLPQIAPLLHKVSQGKAFALEHVRVTPFLTPHDAMESCGYVLSDADTAFGYCTDLGFMPQAVQNILNGCDAVVLESNHDPYMLQTGPYPAYLKRRILGAQGHLSNADCAVCAVTLARNGTKHLILSHLSEKNNSPLLAFRETKCALDASGLSCELYVAPRDMMEEPVALQASEELLCCP